MARLEAEAALASDTGQLMDALPPMANALRYGDVRQTDTRQVARVVDGLVARICIGLPAACASLNDDAGGEMSARLNETQRVVRLLQHADYLVLISDLYEGGNQEEMLKRAAALSASGVQVIAHYGAGRTEPPCLSSGRNRSRISRIPAVPTAMSIIEYKAIDAITSIQTQPTGSAAPEASPLITATTWPPASSPTIPPNPHPMNLRRERARSAAHTSSPPPANAAGNNSADMR